MPSQCPLTRRKARFLPNILLPAEDNDSFPLRAQARLSSTVFGPARRSSSAPPVEKVMCVTMVGTGTAQAPGGGGAEEQPVERLLLLGAFDALLRLVGPIGRVWTGLEAANVEAEAEGTCREEKEKASCAASGSSSPPPGPMSQQSPHTVEINRFMASSRQGLA